MILRSKNYAHLIQLFQLSIILFIILGLSLITPALLFSSQDDNDDNCLICHSNPTLTREKNGRIISLFIKSEILKGTVHEGFGCISCHTDADVEEFPHDTPLQKVDCSICHEDIAAQHVNSLHGKALSRMDFDAPACDDCHGKHVILGKANLESPIHVMNIPATCGKCHSEDSKIARRHNISQRDVIKNYSMSIHGQGLFEGGLIVTAVCTSCHTSHNILPHADPASSINRDNIAKNCMQCHAQIENVHRKVIRGELWEKQPHVIPVCVDCHSPHRIRRVFYTEDFTDYYCLGCHQNRSLARTSVDGSTDSLYVNADGIQHSAHGQGISCVKCHVNVSHENQPVCRQSGTVDCSICHAEEFENFSQSLHGALLRRGDPNAPTCTQCHGEHDILRSSDLASPTFTRNIPTLCARCHREGEKAAVRYTGPETEVIAHYSMSIHGKGLYESGLMVSAVCSNCHSSHRTLPSSDPNSSVHPTNVGRTCGQCHLGIYEEYKNSIHSPTVSKTNKRLPSCNNCHKSHEIERVDKSDFRNEIFTQCGGCHDEVIDTYFDTYHGKVSKLGYTKAAKCHDCHGSHDILPPSAPASTLSRQNIIETCKSCHPNSNRKFTGYLTHATHHNRSKYPVLYYTFWAMTFLLISVFVFFGIHTLLWIPRSIRERIRMNKDDKRKPKKWIVRFRTFPRILHLMVIVSFIGLALTGMTLKFSGFPWALKISRFFGGVNGAGIIHRICALITFGYFGLHFIYIIQNAKKENKNILKYIFHKDGMIPTKQDFKEFFQSMLWFLGRKKPPAYGRWTYWEKFDYFAVFWGVAVIGSTGLVLWFPEFFTKFMPGYLINVATIIHSDEALLATGFIFTIHFFNTHFRPQKFPMDQVIFTGKVPYEEWKRERPREYEMLKAKGMLKELITRSPSSKWFEIGSKIFGYICLIIGFSLVGLILWAMLTQYK